MFNLFVSVALLFFVIVVGLYRLYNNRRYTAAVQAVDDGANGEIVIAAIASYAAAMNAARSPHDAATVYEVEHLDAIDDTINSVIVL